MLEVTQMFLQCSVMGTIIWLTYVHRLLRGLSPVHNYEHQISKCGALLLDIRWCRGRMCGSCYVWYLHMHLWTSC